MSIHLMRSSSLGVLLAISGCQPARPSRIPTFAEDVAPIVYRNCAPCHRPGEAGPFPLLNYRDVVNKAETIEAVTKSHFMPPWPADPSYSHFVGERILSKQEIQTIAAWVENGTLSGDMTKAPASPVFPTGSLLGKPDLVVKMLEPVRIPGDNKDHFMVIKIPYEIPEEHYVRAIEFVPGNRKLMHHMNGHIVQYENQKKNPFEGPYSVDRANVRTLEDTYSVIRLLNDDGSYPELTSSVANYLPGAVSPAGYGAGIGGWKLNRRGAFLMRDVHYAPSPVDTEDQSAFNVYFTTEAPTRPTLELQMGTLGISEIVPPLVIPPNTVKTFTTKTVVEQDISLLTVNPHMHLLGKSFEAWAEIPGGRKVPLVKIPRWDFRWQYFYTFPKMLKIPKGSAIVAVAVYDNTTNNPNNPFSPPREVTGTNASMRSTDEMFQLIMKYVPYQAGDENVALGNGR
jgi:hypothetical protein